MNVEELRAMPDEELIRYHDMLAGNRSQHPDLFLDELNRREMVRQGERMERLTKSINFLTWVIMGVTFVGVALTALAMFGD